jgi:hypothetical protein
LEQLIATLRSAGKAEIVETKNQNDVDGGAEFLAESDVSLGCSTEKEWTLVENLSDSKRRGR